MKREWREDEISAGFKCPDGARTIAMPLCSACLNWNGYGKCKKLGKSPDAYREADRQDCPEAMLDTKRFTFSQFVELCPEAAKKFWSGKNKSECLVTKASCACTVLFSYPRLPLARRIKMGPLPYGDRPDKKDGSRKEST